MEVLRSRCGYLFMLLALLPGPLLAVDFHKHFYFTWTTGEPELQGDVNQTVILKLTQTSGSGFSSRNPLCHGRYGGKIKVPGGFTAGVVTAFYLISEWDYRWTVKGIDGHDEIDLEFMGNATSGGVDLQTNWYARGIGHHEERHHLWFDPTEDFHHYEIIWNWNWIVWLVDGVPIRKVYSNNLSGLFPSLPMFLMGSIWEGSDWTTLGGALAIDWTKEPFYAEFKDFHMLGCYWRFLEDKEAPFCARKDFIATWDTELSERDEKILDYAARHFRYYAWSQDPWRLKHRIGFRDGAKRAGASQLTGKRFRPGLEAAGQL